MMMSLILQLHNLPIPIPRSKFLNNNVSTSISQIVLQALPQQHAYSLHQAKHYVTGNDSLSVSQYRYESHSSCSHVSSTYIATTNIPVIDPLTQDDVARWCSFLITFGNSPLL